MPSYGRKKTATVGCGYRQVRVPRPTISIDQAHTESSGDYTFAMSEGGTHGPGNGIAPIVRLIVGAVSVVVGGFAGIATGFAGGWIIALCYGAVGYENEIMLLGGWIIGLPVGVSVFWLTTRWVFHWAYGSQ